MVYLETCFIIYDSAMRRDIRRSYALRRLIKGCFKYQMRKIIDQEIDTGLDVTSYCRRLG